MPEKYWFPDNEAQQKALAEIQAIKASGKPVNSSEVASKYGGKPLRDAVIGRLTPAAAAITQQLLDYQGGLPSGRILADPDYKSALIAVRQIDPTWNANDYQKRAAALKELTTGKSGDILARTNMVLGHLNQLHDAIPELGNRDNEYWNSIANWFTGKMLGSPKVTNYEVPQEFVANELPVVLRGSSQTSEQDRARTLGVFGRDKAKAQQDAAIKSSAKLLESRIMETRQRFLNALQGTNRPIQVLSPFARKALKSIAPEIDVDALDPPNATAIKAWQLVGVPDELPSDIPQRPAQQAAPAAGAIRWTKDANGNPVPAGAK